MRTQVEERLGTIGVRVWQEPVIHVATHPAATSACLLGTDILALAISRWVAYLIWARFNPSVSEDNLVQFWPSFFLYLIVYASQGLYSAAGLRRLSMIRYLSFAFLPFVAICVSGGEPQQDDRLQV